MMPTLKRLALITATAALLAGAVPATAPAVVPPKNCGTINVGGKRYQIKADRVTCQTALRWSRSYLRTSRCPSGWKRTRYPSSSLFKFRCERGVRNFFGIKR